MPRKTNNDSGKSVRYPYQCGQSLKKMGIWKMMTLTYSSVYTNDCHSKQAQELHIFWRNFMD